MKLITRHIQKFKTFSEQYILNPKDPNESDRPEPKSKKSIGPDEDELEIQEIQQDENEKDFVDEIIEHFEKEKIKRDKWK